MDVDCGFVCFFLFFFVFFSQTYIAKSTWPLILYFPAFDVGRPGVRQLKWGSLCYAKRSEISELRSPDSIRRWSSLRRSAHRLAQMDEKILTNQRSPFRSSLRFAQILNRSLLSRELTFGFILDWNISSGFMPYHRLWHSYAIFLDKYDHWRRFSASSFAFLYRASSHGPLIRRQLPGEDRLSI